MAKYIKKPVVIEAIRITRDNLDEIKSFVQHDDEVAVPFFDNITNPDEKPRLAMWFIHTLEGIMRANIGDWIIKGVNGEFYPCKPDVFVATYALDYKDSQIVREDNEVEFIESGYTDKM